MEVYEHQGPDTLFTIWKVNMAGEYPMKGKASVYKEAGANTVKTFDIQFSNTDLLTRV